MGKKKGARETAQLMELPATTQSETANGEELSSVFSPELPGALQLHLNKVLEAIMASREALEHKIEVVVR